MALEWVLHARYMTPTVNRGSNNYGGQDFGSPCLATEKEEAPFTSSVADASRNTFDYFSTDPRIFLDDTGIGGTIEASNGNKQAVNRAANFLNKDYLLVGDTIYSHVDASGTWTNELSLTGKTATSTSSLGLYPTSIGGVPHLVTAWSVGDGATWRYAKLNGDTNTWTISPALPGGLSITDSEGGVLTEIQHRDRIYYLTSSTSSIGYFDFAAENFGTIPFGTTSRHPMDFCTFMNRLFILNKNDTGSVQILKIEPNSTEFQFNFDTGVESDIAGIDIGETLTTTNQFEGRPLLFVDNIYDDGNGVEPTMWAYYISHGSSTGHDGLTPSTTDTNHGLRGEPMRMDGNGNLFKVTSITSPIQGFRANPFKMMHNQEGAFSPTYGTNSRKDEDMVLRVFVDQKDRGIDGTEKSSIICASRFAGQLCTGAPGGGGDFGNLHYHVFRGSGNQEGGTHPNPPTKDGGAHSFDFIGFPSKQTRHRALPHSMLGGGARHSEFAGVNRIADVVYRGIETTEEAGIIRIYYTIIPSTGNPVGDNVDVRWWYDKNQHAPETPCTLVGTSEGAISGLLATSIIINTAKVYYVDWDARGDGLLRNQRFSLNGQINLAANIVGAIDDPTDINSLVSWFEADDSSTISSGVAGNVSEWRDKGTGLSGVFQPLTSPQPHLVPNANNGLAGVRFDKSNSEFLFASGSPIGGEPATILVIYEPNTPGAIDTFLSLSADAPSGLVTDYEHWSMIASNDNTAKLNDKDAQRTFNDGNVDRSLSIPSGGIGGNTRLIVWRNAPFEGKGQLFPNGQLQETDFVTDGNIEANLIDNTTFGRFSGANLSGVYTSAADYFDGTLYEVAIYNRILADAEIERFRLYAEAKYLLDT